MATQQQNCRTCKWAVRQDDVAEQFRCVFPAPAGEKIPRRTILLDGDDWFLMQRGYLSKIRVCNTWAEGASDNTITEKRHDCKTCKWVDFLDGGLCVCKYPLQPLPFVCAKRVAYTDEDGCYIKLNDGNNLEINDCPVWEEAHE